MRSILFSIVSTATISTTSTQTLGASTTSGNACNKLYIYIYIYIYI